MTYLDPPEESEFTPAAPRSPEEEERISRSRLRAMEERRYAIVTDPFAPGAKEAFLSYFFGHLSVGSDDPIDQGESE